MSLVLLSLAGLGPTLAVLCGETVPAPLVVDWMKPLGGSFQVALDPLAAFFLVLILTLTSLAAICGGPYLLSQHAHQESTTGDEGKPRVGPAWFFYNVLTASMALVGALAAVAFVRLWWLQHGKTHFYLLYLLILVVLGLTWVSVRG